MASRNLSKKKTMGRPCRQLTLEYSLAAKDIIEENNQIGHPDTVRSTAKALKDSYQIDVSRQVLLRDLHTLNLRYKKGERRNINHDAPQNISYRYVYVDQRLQNLNGNCQPIMPEVFFDESYCHLDHHAQKTWTTVDGIVNEVGRKPMMVIFAAFIVFKRDRRCNAKVIEDSVTVWPVNGGKDVNPDYHGHSTSEEFDQLSERLCQSLVEYGSCIIHMDGASYHKRRINPVTTSADRKETIQQWRLNKGYLEVDEEGAIPKMTKAALLTMVKDLQISPDNTTTSWQLRHHIAASYSL